MRGNRWLVVLVCRCVFQCRETADGDSVCERPLYYHPILTFTCEDGNKGGSVVGPLHPPTYASGKWGTGPGQAVNGEAVLLA